MERSRLLGIALVAGVLVGGAGCSAALSRTGTGLVVEQASRAKVDGYPISLRALPQAKYKSYMPRGQRMYSIRYWSRGLDVQGYLDVPPGKGPFPVLVYLHGGEVIPLDSHYHGYPVYTPVMAAESANADSIVFVPNYGGYGPSKGDIGSPYDCMVDAADGLKALSHVKGLQVKSNATYVFGFSLGGFVALALAQHDPQVRAAVLDSPWPGTLAFDAWTSQVGMIHLDKDDLNLLDEVAWAYSPDFNATLAHMNSVQFNKVRVPVLIIGGGKDPIIPPSLVRALYGDLRAAGVETTLHFLPGGHAPITLQMYRIAQKWLLPRGFHLYITSP